MAEPESKPEQALGGHFPWSQIVVCGTPNGAAIFDLPRSPTTSSAKLRSLNPGTNIGGVGADARPSPSFGNSSLG